ncbi:MAG: TlpA disulfide reductase family protein [Candidatus Omnitrophota bacterium]
MKRILAKCFILAVVLFMGACAGCDAIEVGQAAPEFSLNDPDGKTVSLSEFQGKVIILDFFASWCPPCREEIPDFIALQSQYGSQGFTMIGVSLVTAQETKDFAAKTGINYPLVIDDGKVSNAYGPIRSIPTTFVIDKNMNIVKMYIGYRPKEEFENQIKELLK